MLEHFDHVPTHSQATAELFSNELPQRTQVFAAAWLGWILSKATDVLNFGNVEAMAGALFDRTLANQVYRVVKISAGDQTFHKLSAVTGFIQDASTEIQDLIDVKPDLLRLHDLREHYMRLINRPPTRLLLTPLLPRPLINKSRLNSLFRAVEDCVNNKVSDPFVSHQNACKTCDDFIAEANAFGTHVSRDLLGGLGKQLKAGVQEHFNTWEAQSTPELDIVAIAKKYPLMRANEEITFKVRIFNGGNGPARDLMIDEIETDAFLRVETSQMQLGTLQPGKTLVLDIDANVTAPASETALAAEFSWLRPGGRSKSKHEFKFFAQREDIDWDEVELTEPYSLEAVTTEDELIGRKRRAETAPSPNWSQAGRLRLHLWTQTRGQNIIGQRRRRAP